jgi:hypothetical protein
MAETDNDRRLAEPFEPQTMDDVLGMYGVIDDTPIVAKGDIEDAYFRLKQIRAAIKELGDIEKELTDKIAVFMKDKSTLITSDGEIIITWKLSMPSEYFDSKLFRAEQKELYQKYISQRPGSRRFLLK